MIWGEDMGDITREKLNHFHRHHRQMRRYTAAFLAAAALVGCGVGWGLHQTGISATAEAFCGEEEHRHTEVCFEKTLICGDVDGKVEEISVTASEVTSVIRIADIFALEGNILTQNTPTGFPEGTFPLEDKIQTGTAKLEKNQNGTWISATAENVTDGDEIRLSFTYTVSRDDIKENGTYQLPPAFKISEVKSGEIFDQSNQVVGRYTLNTDGLVTLTYTDANRSPSQVYSAAPVLRTGAKRGMMALCRSPEAWS